MLQLDSYSPQRAAAQIPPAKFEPESVIAEPASTTLGVAGCIKSVGALAMSKISEALTAVVDPWVMVTEQSPGSIVPDTVTSTCLSDASLHAAEATEQITAEHTLSCSSKFSPCTVMMLPLYATLGST
jgi:hypothetical protein